MHALHEAPRTCPLNPNCNSRNAPPAEIARTLYADANRRVRHGACPTSAKPPSLAVSASVAILYAMRISPRLRFLARVWRSSAFALGVLLLSSACGSFGYLNSVETLEPPEIEEFPNRQISYSIAGDQNTVRKLITAALSNRTVFHRVEIRDPAAFIITSYLPEPRAVGARRIRQTAYRFEVGESSGNPVCTTVGITWLTKSNGIREEIWSVQSSDRTYVPSSWPDIQRAVIANRCKR